MKFSTLGALLLTLALVGCDRVSSPTSADTSTPGSSNLVVPQAEKEDQWEYLVVSFGKTLFSDIETSITSGQSKLVAFQEFADLLSGSEAVEAQTKLDLLGRFGWDLVSTVGAIGGDQQLVLKRRRVDGRIEKEQAALKGLAEILKAEKAKREARIKAMLADLKNQDAEPLPVDKPIEMDSVDLAERERMETEKARSSIASSLPPVGTQLEGFTITSMEVDVSAVAESLQSKINYSGTVDVQIDASGILLYEGNKYRQSKADQLAKVLVNEIKRSKYLNGGLSYSSALGDFKITVTSTVVVAGSKHDVGSATANANSSEFPGTWARF